LRTYDLPEQGACEIPDPAFARVAGGARLKKISIRRELQ